MKIIDQFLPNIYFEELQKVVLSRGFPWFYLENVSLPPEDGSLIKDNFAKETDGFYHILYDKEDNITSFANEIFERFYEEIGKKFGYTKDKLIRSRLSMKLPKVNFEANNYNLPHVDYYFKHDTVLFYINDSDGDTRMFREFFDENHPFKEQFNVENLISPSANRLVLFDGLQYHTASNPFNTPRRIVLNLNYQKL